ncbi:hypothetical protein JKP88DRAFT_274386 [Tribonema minus]|uniref:WW domain-containing protein n=1 Tax=Tribonema minus TaxID=303371 RepID=A0A836C8I7_9STRA|nr:hypothetical protein JKP88DRAFT_274386 [Tribonema minus]
MLPPKLRMSHERLLQATRRLPAPVARSHRQDPCHARAFEQRQWCVPDPDVRVLMSAAMGREQRLYAPPQRVLPSHALAAPQGLFRRVCRSAARQRRLLRARRSASVAVCRSHDARTLPLAADKTISRYDAVWRQLSDAYGDGASASVDVAASMQLSSRQVAMLAHPTLRPHTGLMHKLIILSWRQLSSRQLSSRQLSSRQLAMLADPALWPHSGGVRHYAQHMCAGLPGSLDPDGAAVMTQDRAARAAARCRQSVRRDAPRRRATSLCAPERLLQSLRAWDSKMVVWDRLLRCPLKLGCSRPRCGTSDDFQVSGRRLAQWRSSVLSAPAAAALNKAQYEQASAVLQERIRACWPSSSTPSVSTVTDPTGMQIIPSGWSAFVDDASGAPYYWHEATNTTSWTLPATDIMGGNSVNDDGALVPVEFGAGVNDDSALVPVEPDSGWVQLLDDESGCSYYFNAATQESKWAL